MENFCILCNPFIGSKLESRVGLLRLSRLLLDQLKEYRVK